VPPVDHPLTERELDMLRLLRIEPLIFRGGGALVVPQRQQLALCPLYHTVGSFSVFRTWSMLPTM